MSVHESGVSRVTVTLHFADHHQAELINDPSVHGGVHPLDTKIPLRNFLGSFIDALAKARGSSSAVTQINVTIERFAGGKIETAYLRPEKIALILDDPTPFNAFLREILDATPPTPVLPPTPNRKLN